MNDNERRIRVAVLGAGGRGSGVTGNLLNDSSRHVEVAAVFDPDRDLCLRALEAWQAPNARVAESYEEAVAAEGVEWVLVFSPNAYHKEHILCAFEHGKHVFSEKPLATTIEDCRAIHEAHRRSGLLFATGFVLRYAPLYRKVREILDSGSIGRLLSFDANENITPGHGGYIMANWRRDSRIAGPHILEKCCHDLDLLNWFTGSVPTSVAAFGGRDFFVSSNQFLMDRHGPELFFAWGDPHRIDTPFHDEGGLMDNLVAVLQYRNGIRGQFQATMSNPIPERRMYFSCTEGTLIAELYTGTLRVRGLGEDEERSIELTGDGHGGGDAFIMKELFDTMVNGTPPKCSGEEGLESAVVALAIDQAAREERIVDLEPVWQSLGRSPCSDNRHGGARTDVP
ncbi:Gfo/Idh/MocA family protein [Verrucomicrobiota bacterium]